MKKFYAVVNTAVILLVIFWNYLSNTGIVNNTTVGDLSDEFANLFTPAGYAFAIWGVIFLGLVILGINQLKMAFTNSKHSDIILKIGPWLTLANIGNAAWLWFWLNKQIGISVLVMLFILFCLLKIIVNLKMEKWDAPKSVIFFTWWPIAIYSGWIAVATIANTSAWLESMDWSPLFTEMQWTVIMVVVATLINLFMLYSRNLREFAAVGVWAIVAIAVRHWNTMPTLSYISIVLAALLFVAIAAHAYKNRKKLTFVG